MPVGIPAESLRTIHGTARAANTNNCHIGISQQVSAMAWRVDPHVDASLGSIAWASAAEHGDIFCVEENTAAEVHCAQVLMVETVLIEHFLRMRQSVGEHGVGAAVQLGFTLRAAEFVDLVESFLVQYACFIAAVARKGIHCRQTANYCN